MICHETYHSVGWFIYSGCIILIFSTIVLMELFVLVVYLMKKINYKIHHKINMIKLKRSYRRKQ
jgi:type IV secretory pathway VirB3-like protein